MTNLLYMNDFDVESCEAKVLSVTPLEDGRVDAVLDQTCFYPRGGGQDWDTGNITAANGTVQVSEVRLDASGGVHHIGTTAGDGMMAGDTVQCEVDHDRRVLNTRLHSAGHVIDRSISSLGLDWVATKGQHYPDLSAVEYSGTWNPDRAETLQKAIENQANEFIEAGSNNTLKFMTPEEMRAVVKHVPDNLPTNKPSRVVFYDDFGIPCGGTHLKNIADIGQIRIPKLKYKKGVIRVTYEIGG